VLHEFDTSSLEGYVHWMYTGSIPPKLGSGGFYMELFELYLLGDFLKDTVFCQRLIYIVASQRGGPPLQPSVCFVWEHTLPSCPLCRVIRELWLATPVDHSIALLAKDPDSPYPMGFVLDMFHELSKHVKNLKLPSYSGKTPEEVVATSKNFIEDPAPEEKK
jgi:hypothetical protein